LTLDESGALVDLSVHVLALVSYVKNEHDDNAVQDSQQADTLVDGDAGRTIVSLPKYSIDASMLPTRACACAWRRSQCDGTL
jgi:hypothetical protein